MKYRYTNENIGDCFEEAEEFESIWDSEEEAEYIAQDAAEHYYENYDGYYEGWYVYNSTVKARALVAYYSAATLTMQLRPNITGQAAGDTFSIAKRSIQLLFKPTPLSVTNLVVTGFRDATLFSQDTDYENEIDGDYEDILVSKACAIWYLNKNTEKYALYKAEADKKLEALEAMNADDGITSKRFSGGRLGVPRIMAYGNTISYQEDLA